jgi:hypothetical protein
MAPVLLGMHPPITPGNLGFGLPIPPNLRLDNAYVTGYIPTNHSWKLRL